VKKSDHLFRLAQALADERPAFFNVKGPGLGDADTQSFMTELRVRATDAFNVDYAEKKICGRNSLCVDFFLPDEQTIVEVALALRNPTSEYERDLLKALMATDEGHRVSLLIFISKPGANKRLSQPGARAIASWAKRKHGLTVEVREMAQRKAV